MKKIIIYFFISLILISNKLYATDEEILNFVKENSTIKNLIANKNIVKEIYVKNRLVNLIVK